MYIEMMFMTEADQHVKVSTDSDNPDGVVVTISESGETDPSKECRFYLGTKEIDVLHKILKDVDAYRGIK
jgi:hypothetical protein